MEEYAWLKEVEAQPLSQAAMDLNKAFKIFNYLLLDFLNSKK